MATHVRVSGSHWKEQTLRFLRVAGLAIVAQLTAIDFTHHIGRTVLISAAVGAAEVVVRQIAPVVPVVSATAPVPPVV